MASLRSRVIRLAHANPALRPHLLPLLAEGHGKTAWHVFIPRDAMSFGYEGPAAERAAANLRTALLEVLEDIRRGEAAKWDRLAEILRENAEVDVQPGLARVVIGQALRYTYMNLAERVEPHFERI